jgi:hypothetical protein
LAVFFFQHHHAAMNTQRRQGSAQHFSAGAAMAELPKSETELIALLTDNPKFADAPVSANELRQKLDAFIAARKTDAAAQAALMQAATARDQAVKELLDAVGNAPTKVGHSSPLQPKLWN